MRTYYVRADSPGGVIDWDDYDAYDASDAAESVKHEITSRSSRTGHFVISVFADYSKFRNNCSPLHVHEFTK